MINHIYYQVTSAGMGGGSRKVLETSNYAKKGHLDCQSSKPSF